MSSLGVSGFQRGLLVQFFFNFSFFAQEALFFFQEQAKMTRFFAIYLRGEDLHLLPLNVVRGRGRGGVNCHGHTYPEPLCV